MSRKKNKKEVWLVLGLFIILLLGYAFLPGIQGMNQPPYTIFNMEQKGTSVFYETLKELDFAVEIGYEAVNKGEVDSIQMIVEPEYRYSEGIASMLKWVEQGGKLVLLSKEKEELEAKINGKKIQILSAEYELKEYAYGSGQILIGGPEIVTNQTLTKNIQGAYEIIHWLEKWKTDRIYFNEYYHGYQKKKSLWRDTPGDIKRIVYQIVFLIILWMIYKGKRLGKAEPFFEEVERTENEYLYAVADLYQQAGFYPIIFENYYDHFLMEASAFFGSSHESIEEKLEDYWSNKDLPHLKELKALQSFAIYHRKREQNPKSKKEQKQYIECIQRIEGLSEIIEMRSEQMWRQ